MTISLQIHNYSRVVSQWWYCYNGEHLITIRFLNHFMLQIVW